MGVFSVWLTACGGGSDDSAASPASATAAVAEVPREAPKAFVPSVPIPADASVKGMWSPVYDWPLVAVHSILMPDGRVMTYGTNTEGIQTGYFVYDIWDSSGSPAVGHLTLPNGTGTDLFCSSQVLLPTTGQVFIAGGDTWTGTRTVNSGNNNSNVFDGTNNSLTRGPDMFRPRWYASSTTLLDGETYVQGGAGGSDRPEIRGADGSFRLLNGIDTSPYAYTYPRNFVAPDGRVFGFDVNGSMYYLDPLATAGQTLGSITRLTALDANYVGRTSSVAMFRPGRLLQFGGNSNGALVIDINDGTPKVTLTQSMSTQRQWVNATLLADGKVLATSGSQQDNRAVGINNMAEIWDPTTGQWLQGASAVKARMYHSNALLLPDGSVLVSGGGAPAPDPQYNNLNAEIYYPPYLFTEAGERAPRPAITAIADLVEIGKTFSMTVAGASQVSRVTLVKSGSTTHSFNMDQRFQDLTFSAAGGQVTVQAPTRAAEAPPGYYLLFAFNESGVPSIAKIVRIGIAADPNPAVVPVITDPGTQYNQQGAAVTLGLVATDPNNDSLTYSATGLPPGMAINPSTGAIAGTPTDIGSYDVVASVSDGINVASAGFVWNISAVVPLVLNAPASPSPALANGNVTYTVTGFGNNPRYKWSFGDGSPETDWSVSPNISHAYAAPGNYIVTVTITDDSDAQLNRSFTQSIYLPATSRKPSASGNLLYEHPVSGSDRLWAVNQDNDSVSVFDAASGAKLAEVAVPSGPRSLALAPDGTIWVVNKLSASISVINPTSRSVMRNILLPRGSQPFGIAMSPTAPLAYVALEGLGQLLRFDTTSYAQTGSLSVGPNPRQVSVAADGASVYVSRFITPPLPGEATASVSTPLTAGGEVVAVDAASMTVRKTIVLRHSDKTDFENQGRGIPNYLGAMTISPDGTQAWVPSKQDNIKRGTQRDGNPLDFQNTVRAISSRIVMAGEAEDYAKRVDHDNASVASAAVFDPRGSYLFVALETSREVAVIDAFGGFERLRFPVGRAPQGLAVSPGGTKLYVNNFMDRSVGIYDLQPLLLRGELKVPELTTVASVTTDKLAANVLLGKQLFYDAFDTRLARDRYMSCASCHNDGGHDGRVWDMSSQGEGLRNTIALRGRAGGQGKLHWSGNFDEVQDFEGQIRTFAGGTGLMSDAAFNTGTRSQPLGDKKAGVSADLDALAAYVASLTSSPSSPFRVADGTTAGALSASAVAGRAVFQANNCAACHGGTAFTNSNLVTPMDIGTLKPTSGKRLGAALTGIDIPTLRDVWATAPYLHDGSAATLDAAVAAHKGVALSSSEMSSLVDYLRQIGAEESTAPLTTTSGTGTGLSGSYFNNTSLSGTPVLKRQEAVYFDWLTASPGTGVNADNFSARWTGTVLPLTSGQYQFRTVSDDGIRLWINNVLVIDNWSPHGLTYDTSAMVPLSAGKPADIRLEYYDGTGSATARLLWQVPGTNTFYQVPLAQLYPSVASPTGGTGLTGSYFSNPTLTGNPVLVRSETVDFAWGAGSPGTGLPVNNFSARWTGTFTAPATGSYVFQMTSDDGARLLVNGSTLINDWYDHGPVTSTSAAINAVAGQRYPITLEYYEKYGDASISLRWKPPLASAFVTIPLSALNPPD